MPTVTASVTFWAPEMGEQVAVVGPGSANGTGTLDKIQKALANEASDSRVHGVEPSRNPAVTAVNLARIMENQHAAFAKVDHTGAGDIDADWRFEVTLPPAGTSDPARVEVYREGFTKVAECYLPTTWQGAGYSVPVLSSAGYRAASTRGEQND